jgi:hypothetical protein
VLGWVMSFGRSGWALATHDRPHDRVTMMMSTMVPTPMHMSDSGLSAIQVARLSLVVVSVANEIVVRRRLAELAKPPQELQKVSDMGRLTPPTVMKITPDM